MLRFKKIRWKNLLSTGNSFTEIDLDKNKTTLIIGLNGHGKSTVLDALSFSLFGKPFRNINKPTLINSINGKDCVTEVEFETYGKNYKIIRGIKPNIFEIHCDGLILNQDSTIKDYQEHLERYIIKMNHKAFTQIVILGSASFTPFMQLSPSDRRTIIENLLDIQIFSVMNVLAKQRYIVNKNDLEKNQLNIKSNEEKKVLIEKNLSSLRQNNEEKLIELNTQLQEIDDKIEILQERIAESLETKNVLSSQVTEYVSLKKKHRNLLSLQAKIEQNLSRASNDIEFYSTNDSCPTCQQIIDSDFKHECVSKLEEKTVLFKDGVNKIRNEINSVVETVSDIERILKDIQNIESEISTNKALLKTNENIRKGLSDSIAKLNNSDNMIKDNEKLLNDTNQKIQELDDEKKSLINERMLIETSLSLLKDGGIKTKIIKQYIPIINKIVNAYLSQMGFFANFNIDENFKEIIKSRYRDEFSYENFSEGEKLKIDMALMLTWRSVAKMKNSVNTNLLLLDEIFDSSLDNQGVESLLSIFKTLDPGTNIFVISHRGDTMLDKFDNSIRFVKSKNFSTIGT